MQKEYKDAMEKISLSENDRERILANVKKTCENKVEDSLENDVNPFGRKSALSLRYMGVAAAACLVVAVAGMITVANRFGGDSGAGGYIEGSLTTQSPGEAVAWEELDSIEDIGEKTDCKTYTLSNVPEEYRVKKVQVAREQRHIRITYKNRKERDKILFEYQETEDDTSMLASQFEEEQMLSEETVGDVDVMMYGEDKCSGMTWRSDSCTFAVQMTKARSKREAKSFVSGTKEGIENAREVDKGKIEKDEQPEAADSSSNAVGWSGDEEPSTPAERKKILKAVYDELGFRITVVSPGIRITYKKLREYESFLFYYPENEELAGRRIIGYAGWESCPEGVLAGFEKADSVTANGVEAVVYINEKGEKLFRFHKQDISFTFLPEGWTGTEYETVLGELLSLVRISMDDGISDDEKNQDNDSSPEEDKDDESDNAVKKDDEITADYREQAQEIQDAVAEGSLYELARFVEYPLEISSLKKTVTGEKDFHSLNTERIFTSAWVDAVVSYDINKIEADSKTFVMGNDTNYLTCKIKDGKVVIAEICVE